MHQACAKEKKGEDRRDKKIAGIYSFVYWKKKLHIIYFTLFVLLAIYGCKRQATSKGKVLLTLQCSDNVINIKLSPFSISLVSSLLVHTVLILKWRTGHDNLMFTSTQNSPKILLKIVGE